METKDAPRVGNPIVDQGTFNQAVSRALTNLYLTTVGGEAAGHHGELFLEDRQAIDNYAFYDPTKTSDEVPVPPGD